MIPPKPRPIIPRPEAKRLSGRPRMTLVAAFRARENGILLCADREETDGWLQKRSVDKIYSFNVAIKPPKLDLYQIFIAGAGPTAILTKAFVEIHTSLENAAADEKADFFGDHGAVLEASLRLIHERYVKDEPIFLIIVFAPIRAGTVPILYRTEGAIVVPETLYTAWGSGKVVADYLADRLYKHGQPKDIVMLLAAFIFREAASSSAGVGREVNMKLIHEGNKSVMHIGPDNVKELMDTAPSLKEAVFSYWDGHPMKMPDWLTKG